MQWKQFKDKKIFDDILNNWKISHDRFVLHNIEYIFTTFLSCQEANWLYIIIIVVCMQNRWYCQTPSINTVIIEVSLTSFYTKNHTAVKIDSRCVKISRGTWPRFRLTISLLTLFSTWQIHTNLGIYRSIKYGILRMNEN